jgi:hypothetical protein
MSAERIGKIRELAEKATPGPWESFKFRIMAIRRRCCRKSEL